VTGSERHRREYEKRVNRVIDHLRTHKSEDLSVESLAAVAGFSPFHFHRVFKSMTGENLMEHIQRTRLEAAATALGARPHADILEIALDHGFRSASAFARAFKERFGMTASAWRAAGPPASNERETESKLGQAKSTRGKASARAKSQPVLMKEDRMNVKVQTLPSYRVAYLRTVGPYGPGLHIPLLWERLSRWAAARDLWNADKICLGISLDNPKVTDPARCRYDAAIVIPDGFKADGDVNVTEVAGGKYATLAFRGTAEEIGAYYDHLFGAWLPTSGYQPDDRFIFELHRGEMFDEKTCQILCEICVPVRPL